MTQQLIGVGTVANDGTGDPLRTAFQKVNANETQLYSQITSSYIVSNWYVPLGISGTTTGATIGANNIKLFPGFVAQTITIGALGFRVNTLGAGNAQCAIYANNPATMRPTGSALASTASISTGSTGNFNAAVSVQLTPGLYWWGLNIDNSTAVIQQINTLFPAGLLGSASQTNNLTTGSANSGVTVSQAFGTWPSLTAASFSDTIGAIPCVQFQVASSP